MLMVIKRSGRKEPFDMEKVRTTLITAGNELDEPLTYGDVDCLLAPVRAFTEGKHLLTSRDIYNNLISNMENLGFHRLAKAYRSGNSSYWEDSSLGESGQ